MTVQVSVTPNGLMNLPQDIRKRLGVADGGTLLVEEMPDGVILRTVAQAISHAQGIARKHNGLAQVSVEAFLAARKPALSE